MFAVVGGEVRAAASQGNAQRAAGDDLAQHILGGRGNGPHVGRHIQQEHGFLQLIRILKNYDFFKEPQLELFKPRKSKSKTA